jgi:multiple sugar transport system permease protein
MTRLERFFKTIYFMPYILSTVISSVLWVSVFHPFGGVMQLLPLPFGLGAQNWYQSPTLVVPGLILFSLWKGLGLYIVIFLAALKNLPDSYFDAARVDGANAVQTLRYITIPLLKPIFLFAIVISIVYGFQNFAIVYTSTKGGPAEHSQILPILIYESAFEFFRMGYASALSVVMFLAMFAFSFMQFRFFKSEIE